MGKTSQSGNAEKHHAHRRKPLLDEIRAQIAQTNAPVSRSNFGTLQQRYGRANTPAPIVLPWTGSSGNYLIARPGDRYEREAHRVAMHATPLNQQHITKLNITDIVPLSLSPALNASLHQAQRGGQRLDRTTPEAMANKFSSDLKSVRIHTDSRADTLNRALHARAFTVGQEIFFRHGLFSPNTTAGQRLLAHELAHVAQQNTSNTASHVLQLTPSDDFTHALGAPSEQERLAQLNLLILLLDDDDLAGAEELYAQLTQSTRLRTRFMTALPHFHADVLQSLVARIRILRDEYAARRTSRGPSRAAAFGPDESLTLSPELLERLAARSRTAERAAATAPPAARQAAVAADVQAHDEELRRVRAARGAAATPTPPAHPLPPAPERVPAPDRPSGARASHVAQRTRRADAEVGREQREAARRAAERRAREAETARPSLVREEHLAVQATRADQEAGYEQREAARRAAERRAHEAETARPSLVREERLEMRALRLEPVQLMLAPAIRLEIEQQEERAQHIARGDILWEEVPGIITERIAVGLLAIAVFGLAVGAGIITGGTATAIGLAMLGTAALQNYVERREEIEAGDYDVSVPATLLTSIVDITGLIRCLEAITGERIGTGRHLTGEERTAAVSGFADLAVLLAGSRAFRAGEQQGVRWRSNRAHRPALSTTERPTPSRSPAGERGAHAPTHTEPMGESLGPPSAESVHGRIVRPEEIGMAEARVGAETAARRPTGRMPETRIHAAGERPLAPYETGRLTRSEHLNYILTLQRITRGQFRVVAQDLLRQHEILRLLYTAARRGTTIEELTSIRDRFLTQHNFILDVVTEPLPHGGPSSLRTKPGYYQIESGVLTNTDSYLTELVHETISYYLGYENVPAIESLPLTLQTALDRFILDGEEVTMRRLSELIGQQYTE